jgi:hypothetical protein
MQQSTSDFGAVETRDIHVRCKLFAAKNAAKNSHFLL